MKKVIAERTLCFQQLTSLKQDYVALEQSLSEEMLNSAKLRSGLEELQILQTQNIM